MPKPTVTSLAERIAVLESEVIGLRSALTAIPNGPRNRQGSPLQQSSKIVRNPDEVVKISCAKQSCRKFASTTRQALSDHMMVNGPWRCTDHREPTETVSTETLPDSVEQDMAFTE